MEEREREREALAWNELNCLRNLKHCLSCTTL